MWTLDLVRRLGRRAKMGVGSQGTMFGEVVKVERAVVLVFPVVVRFYLAAFFFGC